MEKRVAGEVTFQPTEVDYVRANRDWYARTLKRPRTFFGVALVAGVGAWFEFQQGWLGPSLFAIVFAGLLGGGLMGGIYLAIYLIMPRRARRLYRQQASMQQPLTYGWDDAGISFRSVYGSGLLPWPDFHRWSDGRDMFLFYLNDQLFYFLPHRVLTAAQIDDLRATAVGHGVPRF